MLYVIKTIGIALAILGVVMATMPGLMTKVMEYFKVGKRVYGVGVARIIIGALLLLACPSATIVWLPAIIGALIVVSGMLVFALGIERDHRMIDWWESKPEGTRRIGAIIAAVIGVLLIYGA